MNDANQDAFQQAERFIAIESSVIATAQALAIEVLAHTDYVQGDGTVARVWEKAYATAREIVTLSEPLYAAMQTEATAMVARKPTIEVGTHVKFDDTRRRFNH